MLESDIEIPSKFSHLKGPHNRFIGNQFFESFGLFSNKVNPSQQFPDGTIEFILDHILISELT